MTYKVHCLTGIGYPLPLPLSSPLILSTSPILPFPSAHQAYGHRVRLATHANYREFVSDEAGLEFFPLGGDPKILAECE